MAGRGMSSGPQKSDPPKSARQKSGPRKAGGRFPERLPHPRFWTFLGLFALLGLVIGARHGAAPGILWGFDLAAAGFVASCLPLWRSDALAAIQARADRDDGGRVLLPLVSTLAMAVVMLALGWTISNKASLAGPELALVAGTMALAWLFLNLIWAFHYANLYHAKADGGGLEFPGSDRPEDAPLFADFCYFSFVIGMTCQTADVNITSSAMRRVATMQGLVAFVFNLGVVALLVNVLAGTV